MRPILARRNPPLLTARVTSATRPTPVDPHAPDRVALDRRAGPRGDDRPVAIDRFTAATHRPLPLLFGLGAMGRWAIVKGLSLAPGGVLVHLLDTTDPELDVRDRIPPSVWMRLARCADAQRVPSPLWLSTSCVQAPMLVAELSRRASTQGMATMVELVPLAWRDRSEPPPALRCSGVLAPLCDPRPQVLGIALGDAARAGLAALFAPPVAPRAARARAAAAPATKPRRKRTKGEPPRPAPPDASAPRDEAD
ncbi:MAG TPA: hypothetical protein VG755_42605 [Nannocystaceae bacterium]|nr:hypothetical protein [Nannocystaceae bacterium]